MPQEGSTLMGNGKQFFSRMAFLFVLSIGFLMPLSLHADNVYLPLTIKCGGCENMLGAWRIQTPDEVHTLTFLPNGIFKILFQGQVQEFFGNYSCTNNQFEGLMTEGAFSLKFVGAIACSGISASGIFETRINGIIDSSGNFTGQKL